LLGCLKDEGKTVKRLLVTAALLSTMIGTTVSGQSGPELPVKLSGRWTATNPSGIVIDSFSITFEGSRAPGTVPGRLTWRGFNCGAKDEPIRAQWDGTELKFEAVLKADTNTQRSYGTCGTEPVRWVLKRKSDQSFEGEGRVANIVVTVTAAP
jgi:hypothetical protein